MSTNNQFSNFFYPKSIAVIGVSPDRNNLGKNIVMNCLMFGYEGEILSIGLKEGVVFGQQIYSSIEQIDRDIHLAVILTPAKTVPVGFSQMAWASTCRAKRMWASCK